jgi:hypothetical protein
MDGIMYKFPSIRQYENNKVLEDKSKVLKEMCQRERHSFNLPMTQFYFWHLLEKDYNQIDSRYGIHTYKNQQWQRQLSSSKLNLTVAIYMYSIFRHQADM